MASQGHAADVDDMDISLENLARDQPDQFNNDVIPFPRPQPDIQSDSDSSTSSPKTTPSKPTLPKSKAKKARKSGHQTQPSNPSLRPAKDILSRIRHDPALNESEYIIGYHDRHADVMEMPVSSWKGGGDVTDEEWIPQHRILYFRKEGDGEGRRVWDRAARLDRLFGSGVVPVCGERNGLEKRDEEEDLAGGEQEADIAGTDGEQTVVGAV